MINIKNCFYLLLISFTLLLFSNYANADNLNKQNYVIFSGGKKVFLEIADTPQMREAGLMYRKYLPENQGMMFVFEHPIHTSFWMKNTKIPLDILFIYKDKIVKIYENTPICKSDPCRIYPSESKVDYAIELNGGLCKKYNIQTGQKIKLTRK